MPRAIWGDIVILHGRPDKIALAIIDAVIDGRVRTPGQLADLVAHMDALPPRLRSWTLQQLRERADREIVDHIVSRIQVVPA